MTSYCVSHWCSYRFFFCTALSVYDSMPLTKHQHVSSRLVGTRPCKRLLEWIPLKTPEPVLRKSQTFWPGYFYRCIHLITRSRSARSLNCTLFFLAISVWDEEATWLPLRFTLSLSKSLRHRSGKIWRRHSCINNPLMSLEGFEILTKELAGTSLCSGSYGSRGKMCSSPIINHTIQYHRTSRPGLSPRQPDSKIPSLQMALREHLFMCTWGKTVCVILFY